jgi:hypothetical protein
MEKVSKLCCEAGNFESLAYRKIYSSLIVYIILKDCTLKMAVAQAV